MRNYNNLSYPKTLEFAKYFFEYYHLHSYYSTAYESSERLGNIINKKCRFCHRKEPETTFIKDAHTFSKFLGNITGLSYFECDNCNQLFSKYEKHLDGFIGLTKTLTSIHKQSNKIERFENKEGSLKVTALDEVVIINSTQENSPIIDNGNGIGTISYSKKYIPLYAYKTLVKFALCLVNEEDLEQFNITKKFLVSDELDQDIRLKYTCLLLGYLTRNEYFEYPMGYLFSKNNKSDFLFGYTFVFYFHQYVYQISLPFNLNDEWLYSQVGDVSIITAPPLIMYPEGVNCYQLFNEPQKLEPEEMYKTEKVIDEEEIEITYSNRSPVSNLDENVRSRYQKILDKQKKSKKK